MSASLRSLDAQTSYLADLRAREALLSERVGAGVATPEEARRLPLVRGQVEARAKAVMRRGGATVDSLGRLDASARARSRRRALRRQSTRLAAEGLRRVASGPEGQGEPMSQMVVRDVGLAARRRASDAATGLRVRGRRRRELRRAVRGVGSRGVTGEPAPDPRRTMVLRRDRRVARRQLFGGRPPARPRSAPGRIGHAARRALSAPLAPYRALRAVRSLGIAGAACAILAPFLLTALAPVLVMAPLLAGGTTAGGGTSGGATAYIAQARSFADDDSIGYSQSTRMHNPNMDCSSFVWYALVGSGCCTAEQLGGTPFATGTMGPLLRGAGFQEIPFSQVGADGLVAGDILVTNRGRGGGHTEIYVGDGRDIGAHGDHDGRDGDGDGREVCEGDFWDDNWEYVYRPPASLSGAAMQVPERSDAGTPIGTYATREFDLRADCRPTGMASPYGFPAGTAQAQVQRRWADAGAVHDAGGFCTLDGRYLIACTSTFGSIGDKVDFRMSDGRTLACTIIDLKSQQVTSYDQHPANRWGHADGACVLEFCGTDAIGDNPYNALGLNGQRVVGASNLGSVL